MKWTIRNWFVGLTSWREVWYRLTYRKAFNRAYIRVQNGVHVGYYVGGALIAIGKRRVGTVGGTTIERYAKDA